MGAAATAAALSIRAQARARAFQSGRIGITVVGRGPDIVFVPGLGSHADAFAVIAHALRGQYRSHLVQVNGFAGAPAKANAEGPLMAAIAEDLVGYIEEARLDRPAIVGHSMGGTIAMMVAARHPNTVGRLMIVDMIPFAGTFFVGPDATPEAARSRAEEIAAQVLAARPREVAPVLSEMFSGMTRDEAARVRILEWLRLSDPRVVAQSFREVITSDLRPELPKVTVPVTVLYAPLPGQPTHPLISPSYANLPHARLIEIEATNHFIMFDQPDRMIAEIRAFMELPEQAACGPAAMKDAGVHKP